MVKNLVIQACRLKEVDQAMNDNHGYWQNKEKGILTVDDYISIHIDNKHGSSKEWGGGTLT